MITNDIKYGGTLQIGDFIMIGHPRGYNFGWYSGSGKSGNIQFITTSSIYFANDGNVPFNFNNISKSFVRNTKIDTVIKIADPLSVLTNTDLKHYLEAKELLIKINFLKS